MYAKRWRICATCHKPIYDRLPPDGDVHCLDCNTKRAIDAAFSMATKSGNYYDRWLMTRGPQGRPRQTG